MKQQKPPLLKILLIEDDPMVMMVNTMLLKEIGYIPDIAETGEKALKLSVNNYHLILTDIGLPDIDGITVAKKIRENEIKNKNENPAKIIAMTAFISDEVVEKCTVAGISEVLRKPVSPQQLKKLIENFN